LAEVREREQARQAAGAAAARLAEAARAGRDEVAQNAKALRDLRRLPRVAQEDRVHVLGGGRLPGLDLVVIHLGQRPGEREGLGVLLHVCRPPVGDAAARWARAPPAVRATTGARRASAASKAESTSAVSPEYEQAMTSPSGPATAGSP